MARWIEEGTHRLTEWEPDLSSQTGASQAGILLGSNEDIPAFRWVEKETGTVDDVLGARRLRAHRARTGNGHRPARRRRLESGQPPLRRSRRGDPHRQPDRGGKRANPGYRASSPTGSTSRALSSSSVGGDPRVGGGTPGQAPGRAASWPPGRALPVHAGGDVRRRPRPDRLRRPHGHDARPPAVYATFSSYDEVAHHSGLERADTLEALRKLDQQFGRIDRARRYAPRPYVIVVLSDHGQTQGATFKQRNGYGLDDLVQRSLTGGSVEQIAGGDEQHAMVRNAIGEATGESRRSTRRRTSRRAGRRPRLGQPRARLPDGGAAPADARGYPGAPSAPDSGSPRASARRLDPRPLGATGRRLGADADTLPRRRARRGARPARQLLALRAATTRPDGLVPARGRHHGRQLLRPEPRGGLRLRGADLLPRRARRAADTPFLLSPNELSAAGRPDRGRGESPSPHPLRLAAAAGERLSPRIRAGRA